MGENAFLVRNKLNPYKNVASFNVMLNIAHNNVVFVCSRYAAAYLCTFELV